MPTMVLMLQYRKRDYQYTMELLGLKLLYCQCMLDGLDKCITVLFEISVKDLSEIQVSCAWVLRLVLGEE
jgi:hypothetical protein